MQERDIIKTLIRYLKSIKNNGFEVVAINKDILEALINLILSKKAKIKELDAHSRYLSKCNSELRAELKQVKAEKDALIKTYRECNAEIIKEFSYSLIKRIYDIPQHCFDLSRVLQTVERARRDWMEGNTNE
jgi:hypothetical protein